MGGKRVRRLSPHFRGGAREMIFDATDSDERRTKGGRKSESPYRSSTSRISRSYFSDDAMRSLSLYPSLSSHHPDISQKGSPPSERDASLRAHGVLYSASTLAAPTENRVSSILSIPRLQPTRIKSRRDHRLPEGERRRIRQCYF